MTVDRVTRIFYAVADRRASLIGFANELMAEHTLHDHYRSIEALRFRRQSSEFTNGSVYFYAVNVPFYFHRVFYTRN